MRLIQSTVLLLLAGSACDKPTGPTPPWYVGEWLLVDSIVVDYAFANYGGSGATVTFELTDSRNATIRLSPVGRDSVEAVIRGAARRVVRSSASADVEWNQPLDFTDTLRVPAGYIVGMYMSAPDDSLPFPSTSTEDIYWIADTLAVCASWRVSLADPLNNLVPGSFACRHRMRWRRP